MVLLFLAGVSQLNFHCAEYLFLDKLDFEIPISRFAKVNYFLFLARLIFESQNLSLFQNLASMLQGAVLSAPWHPMSPFDCRVLTYFLAWCDCSLKLLNLSGCGLSNQSLEIMHRVNLEHHGTTQIEDVNLNNNIPEILTKLSLLSKLSIFWAYKGILPTVSGRSVFWPGWTPLFTELEALDGTQKWNQWTTSAAILEGEHWQSECCWHIQITTAQHMLWDCTQFRNIDINLLRGGIIKSSCSSGGHEWEEVLQAVPLEEGSQIPKKFVKAIPLIHTTVTVYFLYKCIPALILSTEFSKSLRNYNTV